MRSSPLIRRNADDAHYYGVLIMGVSLYALWVPPARATVLGELHPGIWWGALLVGLGSINTYRYYPRRYRS